MSKRWKVAIPDFQLDCTQLQPRFLKRKPMFILFNSTEWFSQLIDLRFSSLTFFFSRTFSQVTLLTFTGIHVLTFFFLLFQRETLYKFLFSISASRIAHHLVFIFFEEFDYSLVYIYRIFTSLSINSSLFLNVSEIIRSHFLYFNRFRHFL